ALGFKALATTSAGFAFTRGLADGQVRFDEMIQHCREVVAATSLPVSGDLGCGKGHSPESAAEAIFAAEAAGLAGCSIEDATGALAEGHVWFDELIQHCRGAVAASALPVSGDLGCGKGHSPESAAEAIFAAEAAGLAGCSIEDATGDKAKPIYDYSHAIERVAAAVEAARSLKRDFVFTARADNFFEGVKDLDDTILRLQAFEKAGADVVYAPG